MALDEAIEHTPKEYSSYPAYCRVRRKLSLNRNSNLVRMEDHRRLVPWVKHGHGSKEADEEAAKAKAEAERIAAEKELERERLYEEIYQRHKKADEFIEAHNDSVAYW
jgi:uncharacterized membrane protein YqiK